MLIKVKYDDEIIFIIPKLSLCHWKTCLKMGLDGNCYRLRDNFAIKFCGNVLKFPSSMFNGPCVRYDELQASNKKVTESSRETIFILVIERLTAVVDNVLHNE